ncbi:ubiquitin specific proteinase-like protein [Leptotrombidium deliense]|uniref:Ubiquitin specific proteinase-like protein n=1 Tax=Leptotrombidium deliense TaxID=299467 RepID=A0A443SF09_9ACAR|nr:ubiquitin specific proteinase-like protein [Leptotrombidium deliense]
MSFVPQTKGLLNKPGQNNCFLNSAVQVLWHLDVFRRSFRELTGHACLGHDSCIFCALKELFTQFQYSRETVLPPDSLRRALAETFSDQRRFQLGFMDDAAECFENMLLRLHSHLAPQESEDNCNAAHCISHEKFAMNLVEQIICTVCGATSEPLPFTQMVHYVSTPALCHQANTLAATSTLVSFGELLRSAGALGDIRNCPKACGARVHINRTLCNRPDIVSIGLVWDSDRPSLKHISDVFRVIGTSLRLQDVFDNQINAPKPGLCKPVSQKSSILQLAGLVTYYGKHFSTFFYHTKLEAWIYFDDAAVREIGPHWEQVIEKCIRGHFQPLLLLYTNPNGTAVDTTNAPKTITMIPNKTSSHTNNLSSLAIKRNVPFIPKNLQLKPLSYQSRQIMAVNQSRCYRGMQPLSVDDLLVSSNSASEDVPDSPLTKSSSSSAYFSDIGEVDNSYLSRQMLENILLMQQMRQRKQRSSTSSIESFDLKKSNDVQKSCSLQRCDSGNSSNSSANSDRVSSSSGSSVASEKPYFSVPLKRSVSNSVVFKNNPYNKQMTNSDCGYDTFSLSSSDSYPTSAGPSTPVKHNRMQQRLSQIPEDVQYMELINNCNLQDCDKLCSEADLLLLKSHEKEREGDIKTAAMLSDSAAQKARSAMDAPYSNPQTMITAKIKHSMCVMRSASLHRRVKEVEAEEKRRLKAEAFEIQHSRQNSRDSNGGKHSRQNSKDSTLSESAKKECETPQSAKTVELYATLPKKNARKKMTEYSMVSSSSSLRIKEERRSSIPSILDSLRNSRKADKMKEMKSDAESMCSVQLPVKRHSLKSPAGKESDSNYSDYYSEFEVNKSSKILRKVNSGSCSGRENDSECYAEFDTLGSKKQNRVRRKLLIGGFMKRKNRSLPDLREGSNQEISEPDVKTLEDTTAKSVAQVSRKGFHKISGLGSLGVCQRTSLIKVNTPHVENVQSKLPSNTTAMVHETPTKSVLNNGSVAKPLTHVEHEMLSAPPPPVVISCRQSPTNVGIEPNEELPPPPDDFLFDLRENRNEFHLKDIDQLQELCLDNTKLTAASLRNDELRSLPPQLISEVGSSTPTNCVNEPKSDSSLKSVRDLAQRFERLASKSCTNSVVESEVPVVINKCQTDYYSNFTLHSTSCHSNSSPTNRYPPSQISYMSRNAVHCGNSQPTGRVVALLGTNVRVGPEPCTTSQSHQMSSVSPPPALTTNGAFVSRPEKPPDYQTAMKRLGLMKAEMTNVIQQHNNRLSASSVESYNSQLTEEYNIRSKRKCGPKKCVSFSDEVVLVASAEFEDDEHFPNPLLERILANSNILSMTDKSQEVVS